MNCPTCGQVARGRFCTNCGTRLIDQERVTSEPAQDAVEDPSPSTPETVQPESAEQALTPTADAASMQEADPPSPVAGAPSLEVERVPVSGAALSISLDAEPMTLGQIVSKTVAILRGNLAQFFGLAAAYAVAMFVGMAAFVLFAAAALGSLLTGSAAGSVVGLVLGGIALVAIAVVASAVMACAYISIARGDEPFDEADLFGSTTVTLERAWRACPNVLLALLALLSVWVAIGIVFGLISAFAGASSRSLVALVGLGWLVVAVWLGVSFAFVPQAAVIDHARGIAALSRSMQMVSGNWWRACGYLVVAALVGAGASIVVGLLTAILANLPLLGGLITALLIAAITAMLYAYFITYSTLVFVDLKARERAGVGHQQSAISH